MVRASLLSRALHESEREILVRSLLARLATVLGIAAMAAGIAAAPAQAQDPADVTMVCTQFGTAILPENAPPIKAGVITIEVDGQLITTQFVPGPCNAPGFVKVAG